MKPLDRILNLLEEYGFNKDRDTNVWSRGTFDFKYNDGDEIERYILESLKSAKDVSTDSEELNYFIKDWPSLYHLTYRRNNLLAPFKEWFAGKRILEIGCGCGAISRFLGESGAEVISIEGSYRRATIARERCRDLKNVEIICTPSNLVPDLGEFDAVLLIGVLEYARCFLGTKGQHLLLEDCNARLAEHGHLFVAIENKLGIKYFAGANEDHTGMPMFGINSSYSTTGVATFGRIELKQLLEKSGFQSIEEYLPLPDYKIPCSIVTPLGWEKYSKELTNLAIDSVHQDQQGILYPTFSIEQAVREIWQNNIAEDLSNSFLMIASKQQSLQLHPTIAAIHYSGNRDSQFRKELYIREMDDAPQLAVENRRTGITHALDTDSAFAIKQNLADYDRFIQGNTLFTEFLMLVNRPNWTLNALGHLTQDWLDAIKTDAQLTGSLQTDTLLPGRYWDATFFNAIRSPSSADIHLFDLEWNVESGVELGYLIYRTLIGSFLRISSVAQPDDASIPSLNIHELSQAIFQEIGFTLSAQEIDQYLIKEGKITVAVNSVFGPKKEDWYESIKHFTLSVRTTLIEQDHRIQDSARIIAEKDWLIGQNQIAILESRNELILRATKIQELASIIDQKEHNISELEQNIHNLYHSTSWIATKPIRFISRLFRNPRRTLKELSHRKIREQLSQLRSYPFDQNLNDSSNLKAIQHLSSLRLQENLHPNYNGVKQGGPIDITVVTYNSARWVDGFFQSLLDSTIDHKLIHLIFVDNTSTDSTVELLTKYQEKHAHHFSSIKILNNINNGFGSGHHLGIMNGTSDYILVTNIDLEFDKNALAIITQSAWNDHDPLVASWELRQFPHEHPKYYDPVTQYTNWSSHACILIKREAYIKVNGYEPQIFMYAEDVELSYRFRAYGYRLRYCPDAFVYHYSYDDIHAIKPLQYTHSIIGNAYLRLRYGTKNDQNRIVDLFEGLLHAPAAFQDSKAIVYNAIQTILKNKEYFQQPVASMDKDFSASFWDFDYELVRLGATYEAKPALHTDSLVSVIVRTYNNRGRLLKEALRSIENQTYPNIEIIIVEDGGNNALELVNHCKSFFRKTIKYYPCDKVGRSTVGNIGLREAQGTYCLFLDDDDLLFADHIESLIVPLEEHKEYSAAYSSALVAVTDISNSRNDYVEQKFMLLPLHDWEFNFDNLLFDNYFPIQSILFRRQLFIDREGFNESLDYLEDWNLWIRYAYNNQFKYVRKTTSLYRVPVDNEARNEEFKRAFHTAKNDALEKISTY